MLAENIVLYLQNTHFVLLFNILCIEFHETFCEASLNYSQHAGCKKFRYCLLWKGEKSHWCKDWGWCKDRSMTVRDLTYCHMTNKWPVWSFGLFASNKDNICPIFLNKHKVYHIMRKSAVLYELMTRIAFVNNISIRRVIRLSIFDVEPTKWPPWEL